jgi:hypothetical protein
MLMSPVVSGCGRCSEKKNYRPDFSSERAPHITKSISLKIIKEKEEKIGRGSEMGA